MKRIRDTHDGVRRRGRGLDQSFGPLGNDNGHVTRSQDGIALLSEFFPQTFPAESQEADGALTLRPLRGAISHSIPWRLPGP